MPSEGIRSTACGAATGANHSIPISVRGRTVRVRLTGILDRDGTACAIQVTNQYLAGGRWLVVLDGSALAHLDYRCVPMLVRWSRGLATFGHRLVLDRWSDYLKAILAMEDWDGELERETLGGRDRPAWAPQTHIQAL